MRFLSLSPHSKNTVIDKTCFSITYIGGITPERGIDTVIEAMNDTTIKNLNIVFYIIGADRSEYVYQLKYLANKLKLNKSVILDWIPI